MMKRDLPIGGVSAGGRGGAGTGYMAGATRMSAFAAQAQPVARKQIAVGGKAVKVVDIHGHLVIPESEKTAGRLQCEG